MAPAGATFVRDGGVGGVGGGAVEFDDGDVAPAGVARGQLDRIGLVVRLFVLLRHFSLVFVYFDFSFPIFSFYIFALLAAILFLLFLFFLCFDLLFCLLLDRRRLLFLVVGPLLDNGLLPSFQVKASGNGRENSEARGEHGMTCSEVNKLSLLDLPVAKTLILSTQYCDSTWSRKSLVKPNSSSLIVNIAIGHWHLDARQRALSRHVEAISVGADVVAA